MTATYRKKLEVSDPGNYDPHIANQKRRVRQHPRNAEEWLELGRLHEAKLDLTNDLARRHIAIRYYFPFFLLFVVLGIILSNNLVSSLALPPWQSKGLFYLLIAIFTAVLLYMWSLRYPKSGGKFFRKAVMLDPNCGEAYMYLGLIALMRYQKRKGCCLLEQAVRLGVNDSKIERKLKSIYEEEFMDFFKARNEKEIKQQKIIASQKEQIRELHTKVATLERLTQSLNERVDQAKWEVNKNAKLMNKEMRNRLAANRRVYEDQIADLKQAKESREEAKELAERDFVRLTTEAMEARAALEVRSLTESAKVVEDIMGACLWQALSEQTRIYMATAEQVHNVLSEQEEKPDYSLVGMELCKALETELNRMLVDPFVKNLNGNQAAFLKINQTGESKGKPIYFTYLARVVDQENHPKVTSLTLGQYHFILKRTLDGDYALKEYSYFLAKACSASEVIIDREFLKKLKIVTQTYRNTIAHRASMNKKQFDHLRKLIFAGKEALLKTCCRLRMEKP